ncbi:putative magnesium transporter NIPA3 isoform X2 [Nicotiana tabacum]|uniref:Probable magnesium transporter n=1 Tax=Nicotiana tabacum TaxID=4097 RepID=A0A1S4AFS7_TOBAC|nr:probable magnesium transporter NIPA3 isoform X2 [Nicotiana tomentosiformis]XP_016475474.1 PREDICTED: probable magnesium transporter NIPA3 isoform X2 [Nicotiana tabacum]
MGSSQQPTSFGDPQEISSDNVKGLCLAISSSLFIGSSFIIKKKGLQKAGASGVRAGAGGYSYLLEPLWWAGMITMIVGEIANFAAYAFAPAVLVTPLGALSIIISAALAHMILGEKLHIFGMVGCVLCIVGSTTICLHAPQERQIESVKELWDLATEPAFLLYATLVIVAVVIIIVQYIPKYGQTHIIAYIGVCSLVGSIGVMSVRALGIALKLTFSGMNQLLYPQTWVFAVVMATCVFTQMNYLNKDWSGQTAIQIITELCAFVTILSGTFLLHKTKDLVDVSSPSMCMRYPKHDEEESDQEGIPLKHRETMR